MLAAVPKHPTSTVSLISGPGPTALTVKVFTPKGWVMVNVPGFGVLSRKRMRWKALIVGGPVNRAASRANTATPLPDGLLRSALASW